MTEAIIGQDRLTTVIRWAARVWSVPGIGALLLPTLVEGSYWLQAQSLREVIDRLCFLHTSGADPGLASARPGRRHRGGQFRAFPPDLAAQRTVSVWAFFALIAAPGFLFLVCWLRARYRQRGIPSLEEG